MAFDEVLSGRCKPAMRAPITGHRSPLSGFKKRSSEISNFNTARSYMVFNVTDRPLFQHILT